MVGAKRDGVADGDSPKLRAAQEALREFAREERARREKEHAAAKREEGALLSELDLAARDLGPLFDRAVVVAAGEGGPVDAVPGIDILRFHRLPLPKMPTLLSDRIGMTADGRYRTYFVVVPA